MPSVKRRPPYSCSNLSRALRYVPRFPQVVNDLTKCKSEGQDCFPSSVADGDRPDFLACLAVRTKSLETVDNSKLWTGLREPCELCQ